MAKEKVRYRYRDRKKTGRRHRKPADWHVLPDVLDTVGAAYPALDSGFIENVKTGNFGAALENIEFSYTDMTKLIPAAELVIVGEVARYIGKHTRLGKIGTKKVKLL